METTKKLNETPLLQEMNDTHSYVVVDDDGNVSRIRDVAKEYVTETELNDFIKPYDERITTNQTNIENVKNDALDLETYIDIVTPKNTASGELVHITDALLLATFENKVSGNVEQETTTGKQLIDITNYKLDSEGRVGIDVSNLVIGQQYTFSSSVAINTMKISTNSTGHNSVIYENGNGFKTHTFTMARDSHISEDTKQYLFIKTNSTTWVTDISQLGDLQIELGDTASEIEKFTGGQASPNPDYPQEIEVIEAHNLFNPNNTINAFINNNKIQSLEDAYTYYVKAKPNTTYTFKRDTLGTNPRYLLGTINKFPENGDTVIIKNIDLQTNKYTFTTDSDTEYVVMFLNRYTTDTLGENILLVEGADIKPYLPYGCVGYKVNGKNLAKSVKNTPSATQFYSTLYLDIELKPSTTYTIGFIAPKDCKLYFNEKIFKYLAFTGTGKFQTYTVTTLESLPSSQYYNGLGWLTLKTNSGNTVEAVITDVMLVEGVVNDLTYEPYKEQITYLDLKGNFVGAINDTIKDYLVTDKKKYWLVKNVGKVVLDGSEHWQVTTRENGYQFQTTNDLGKTIPLTEIGMLSNYFKGIKFNDRNTINESTYAYNADSDIRILTDIAINAGEFKQWLKKQYDNGTPVIVYYVLAEPQIIGLGELEDPITTFEGVNNIQLLANLDTEIEVVYAQDVKKYIDSKLAEISAQII